MQTPVTPSSSPSPSQMENGQTRKRQRSNSMHSDPGSSSPKRALSEGPSHDDPQPGPADPPAVDAYMHAQGEDPIPPAFQPAPPLPAFVEPNLTPPEKHARVLEALRAPMQLGETWHVVAQPWFRRWEKACTGEVDKEGAVEEKDLGPVDNAHLVDADGQIAPSLVVEGVDVRYVPASVWAAFEHWYGRSAHPIARAVIPRGNNREPTIELRPPRVRVMKLLDTLLSASTQDIGIPVRYVTTSAAAPLSQFIDDVTHAIDPSPSALSRIWQVPAPPTEIVEAGYPMARLFEVGGTLLQPKEETVEDAIEPDQLFVVELQENGHWLVEATRIKRSNGDPPESQGMLNPLFNGTGFFDRMAKSLSESRPSYESVKSENRANNETVKSMFKPSTAIASSYNSSKSSSKPPGAVGLTNLGNTCFMNSALQCLAHTQQLVDYFLTGVFEDELNPDNPLGMHGAIAEGFGALLQRLWSTSTGSSSSSYSSAISPREFKSAIQKFAPQFSGYQQHDTQELVAFLLDGLHEDLNRIIKKPYTEKPDWNGGDDADLVKFAKMNWDLYLQRNDSVIVDLFQGQYRSTLVCPECQKVSITFDPFMYLTLPLPITRKWKHVVHYVPWDTAKPHLKITVEINANSTFKDLRALIGRWMEVDPPKLLTMEEFSHRFYKLLDDGVVCGEMGANDNIWCFELPCPSQHNRAYKRQPDDPFILPFMLKSVKAQTTRYGGNSQDLFGFPGVVVIDPKDAASKETIYEAIMERLQRWTTHARDLFSWEGGAPDIMEEVLIPITGLPSVPVPVTEIHANGEVVMREEAEEDDIVDEKSRIMDDAAMDVADDGPPRRVGAKDGVFELLLLPDQPPLAAGLGPARNARTADAWGDRIQETHDSVEAGGAPVLVRENDAFYLEFDENMRSYFFDAEFARFETWQGFTHPEVAEAAEAAREKKRKGITLDDCLQEFTKEEQLGEDDLWFCPQCKKHQQATKKFDLWSAPDILVVHLKRFSNSRMLRDKIDALVEFPTEGLDLSEMVQEREFTRRLQEQGVDIASLGLKDIDEPLLYDLYAVDEHLGGLGGGHYRAYALNHITEEWYHFDDSFVSPAKAEDAVNANAYLLFYKRRTARPLGGKSHDLVEAARARPRDRAPTTAPASPSPPRRFGQLPTPPSEGSRSPWPIEESAPDGLLLGAGPFEFPEPSSTRGSPSWSENGSGGEDMEALDEPVAASSGSSVGERSPPKVSVPTAFDEIDE